MARFMLLLFGGLLLTGCGSMSKVGPLYVDLDAQCAGGGVVAACTGDSGNLGFARKKLERFATHFTLQARERANSGLVAGNVGITSSLLGVISAVLHSREGVVASALVGVPSALFAQRYNLSGQTQIYLRGTGNFQCMVTSLRDLERFASLYSRVPPGDRLPELMDANAMYEGAPAQVDSRITAVVLRTEKDLITGIAAVDTAMITSAFEKYAGDLKSAQEKISFGTLWRPPTVVAGVPPPLTEEEKVRLKALAVKLNALSADLDKCIAL